MGGLRGDTDDDSSLESHDAVDDRTVTSCQAEENQMVIKSYTAPIYRPDMPDFKGRRNDEGRRRNEAVRVQRVHRQCEDS